MSDALQRNLIARLNASWQEPAVAAQSAGVDDTYEQGRRAMESGASIADLVVLAHRTLHEHLRVNTAPRSLEAGLERATLFLTECLAPFEMSHRGYRESIDTLRKVNDTLEAEIQRIGHVLHDQAGQLLFSVQLTLRALEKEALPAARPQLHAIAEDLKGIHAQLRDLSHELVPSVLTDLGWYPALQALATSVAGRSGLQIVIHADDRERLPASHETAIYRTVYEALANVVRHANAQHVTIRTERRAGQFQYVVVDDGVGFDASPPSFEFGLGLRAMRERLQALNGSLTVRSSPDRGTSVQMRLPINQS